MRRELGALVLAAFAVPAGGGELHFGFAKHTLTPAIGERPVFMAGFDNDRRTTGVHDDLWAAEAEIGHIRQLREQISLFTGEYQFTLDQVLRDIIGRCRELRLRLTKGERQTKLDFAIMLTVHTVHLLHRRDTWHPL